MGKLVSSLMTVKNSDGELPPAIDQPLDLAVSHLRCPPGDEQQRFTCAAANVYRITRTCSVKHFDHFASDPGSRPCLSFPSHGPSDVASCFPSSSPPMAGRERCCMSATPAIAGTGDRVIVHGCARDRAHERQMESGMRMLQVEELIRQIEAAEGIAPHEREDRVRAEIDRVLEHLRAALDMPSGREPPSRSDSSSRPDLWYH